MRFTKHADFQQAHFTKFAYFRETHFTGPASFRGAHFTGAAGFQAAHFTRDTNFQEAHFTEDADFQEAHFTGDADFQEARFTGPAYFRETHFTGGALFQEAHLTGPASFQGARFQMGADFSDGCFKARTVFDGAECTGAVPRFFHREMHQNTGFSDDPKLWPEVTAENAKEGKRAYTRLRQVAAEIYDPDLEHFFLRQEMRCKARIEWDKGALFHWAVFQFYRWVADSGGSVARPAVGLGLVICLGWAMIGTWLKHGTPPEGQAVLSSAPIAQGLGISIGNTLPFLGLVRKMHPTFYQEAPAWLDAVSGFQSVAGIVLLFFLGLGLRNRFRLK